MAAARKRAAVNEPPANAPAVFAPQLQTMLVPIDSLNHDPANARLHAERNMRAICSSLARFGQLKPIVVQEQGRVIRAGNGTVMAARSLGWTQIAAVVMPMDEATAVQFAIADNRTAELAEWDDAALAKLLQGMDEPARRLVSFEARDLAKLLGDPDVADAPELEAPAKPITKPGDVIELGRHRLLCGDSTVAENVQGLLQGTAVSLTCTDPPYCSGGFQETGKAAGSVGTSAKHKQVANDRLSTRGFQALLRAAFGNLASSFLYSFTDWRMWTWLFDVVESSGYGVRQMIVWDKETPGMGRGWRAQHELVMWATKDVAPFDKHASGHGNVIRCKRSGNPDHTTQKPIDVLHELLAAVPFCTTVADPFAGSGTTLLACEGLDRTCFAFELEPGYCDVIVNRWEKLTGHRAVRPGSGAPPRKGRPKKA